LLDSTQGRPYRGAALGLTAILSHVRAGVGERSGCSRTVAVPQRGARTALSRHGCASEGAVFASFSSLEARPYGHALRAGAAPRAAPRGLGPPGPAGAPGRRGGDCRLATCRSGLAG